MLWNRCIGTVLLLLCLSYSTPTLYLLVHCVICGHLQVCSSICFGIFRNTIPNSNSRVSRGSSFNSFPCRFMYLSRDQLGIYYSESYFSKFFFLCPTYTGTAILSCTKQYYSPKHYPLYQFIFSSNEYVDDFICYGFVYFKIWLKHKFM